MSIEAKKSLWKNCFLIKPFIPPMVNGNKMEEFDTVEIANKLEFFKFHPGENGIHLKAMARINILLTQKNSC
ncbi:hypothetical protein [Neobacillus massiliamazoniensis]|uniref:hypothetical protein n=1 Tax=Neobacillus massiliamazoniensis TaxID=1499688 RepID=UPI001FDEEDE6|nr:hypothetical protein [Neobacillus massiliamazoniensis]